MSLASLNSGSIFKLKMLYVLSRSFHAFGVAPLSAVGVKRLTKEEGIDKPCYARHRREFSN